MGQIDYGNFTSVDVSFDKDAALVDPSSVGRLSDVIVTNKVTDLFVISHGWNNNIPEAIDHYTRFFDRVRAQLDAKAVAAIANRKFAVMAIFWPSKRFTDEDAIPGGAAAAVDARAEQINETLDNLADLFRDRGISAQLEEAKLLVDRLEDDEPAQDRFVEIARGLLGSAPEPDNGIDQIGAALKTAAGHDVLQRLRGPIGVVAAVGPSSGGDADSGGAADLPDIDERSATGGATDLGAVINSIKDAALGLLNVTTYATMKDRAGVVGRNGAAKVLDTVHAAHPDVRLHLIGHSFGGRLVTAAADAAAAPAATLTLLQAAYSHYGFSKDYDGQQHDGFFRRVLTGNKIRGPILISHSVQDKAVGLAYPLASRLLNQQASALGDENDPFGGMGRNGAQKTPEVADPKLTLEAPGFAYRFRSGVPNNLNGDALITSHGDICRDDLAYALLVATSTV